MNSEKITETTVTTMEKGSIAHYDEGLGDLQVLKLADSHDVKVAKDGITVLIPQPSDDPNDPLNWSWSKKHLVLLSIIWASLLTDFSMTWGSPLFVYQAPDFHRGVVATSHSITGGIFLQGPGGVLAVPLIQRYGRLPVLFWSQFLCALFLALAAIAPGYASFTAFRTMQGFFKTAPQVLGLCMVHDMFFFHERARKVNLWVMLLMGGPAAGAFMSAWLITVIPWGADYGVCAGLYCFSFLMVIVFGDETLYDRMDPKVRQKGVAGRVKLLLGWTGVKESEGRPTILTVFADLLKVQIRPQILLISAVYVTVLIAWVIGIMFTARQFLVFPPFSFSPRGAAAAWTAPLVGSIIGGFWGHWFNDFLQRRYIKRHNGKYVLENRLWGAYAPTLMMFVALVLYGQAIQHAMHWMVLLLAWGFQGFAFIAAMTAVSAYALDCLPQHASLVAAIINFWRTTGGFCMQFFLIKWVTTNGPGIAFGLQAMILGVAFTVGVVCTHIFGQRWRYRYPPPAAEN